MGIIYCRREVLVDAMQWLQREGESALGTGHAIRWVVQLPGVGRKNYWVITRWKRKWIRLHSLVRHRFLAPCLTPGCWRFFRSCWAEKMMVR